MKHEAWRHGLIRESTMLDTTTLKTIHNAINDNDYKSVEYIRSDAIKELGRLKIAGFHRGLNAFERKDIDINVEIITTAEAKLNGDG